ncbi:N,N-dimethylformamidase beta subunit family domain-containing protein [Halosolutus gelatinilyticus]|uniref:N,N-dimethylformamidase beta subunit family domain-containing protein n=1 Tax=Halosolutus gelatinilyticus TaxID=2931975 RepID=UPI001FF673DD|nr:N,N-dimethylformamidase beta subunit family domain-containing protein [Halosolutus gelatinilyticus]
MARDARSQDTGESTTDGSRDKGVSRRRYLKTSAGVAAVPTMAALSSVGAANPVNEENQRSGDDDWLPTAPGGYRPTGTHFDDVNHHVEGYPSQPSVVPGESLDFHVSTDPAATYRIDVYRLGWYDGAGGRHVTSLPEKQGENRPIPDWDSETGLIECDWPVTDTLDVPKQWTSGAYLAQFVATSGEYEGESTGYLFAVRERDDRGRSSKVLAQLPLATEQAYNGWGGKSLYSHTSAKSPEKEETGGTAANKVSYNRPIGGAPGPHMRYALHAVRFLEREGYDVSYATDVDVHRNPEMLQDRELALSLGHDEYWSGTQRDAFDDARDSGTNIAFLAANTALWQVRFEDDERTLVCYKETVEDDPQYGEQSETDSFRNLPDPRPECELLGVMGTGAGLNKGPNLTVVEDALDHPWFDDTGFAPGDEVVGVLAHEWDYTREDCDVPGELTKFFHYEGGTSDYDWIISDTDADSVAYQAPSGARVFSCGSLGFTWALDPDPSWDQGWPIRPIAEGAAGPAKPEVMEPDRRLQQFTRNVLDDLQKPIPPADGDDASDNES